ncbi:D-alanyl-D-alanine carboxypeptidase/D-alanyl-D-alanine endopeptidase [Glycomyces salinus]|uniref:D-alanyl-D-alanine carboxypeptidase/D-alanyl-D-alanine endopeptidase n=1 Tax=Glycomyces salinus TaxID=980294 RepID=UPI0018ED9F78|nr:D-alanyl-D-alanine carboxypeptidase/D-alanyl-D-alanine-endopeptidase [Glycomyces salinus]
MTTAAPSPPRSALASRLDAILDSGRLPGRVGAVFAEADSGRILYERDPDRLLTPASALKVATAVAAAHRLGHQHRIPTSLAEAGGDAVALLAGGDVTLSRNGIGHYPGAASLGRLARTALVARGGRTPRTLIVDPAARGAAPAPGTDPEDLRHATAPMAPIMLNGGRLRRTHDRRRHSPGAVAVRSLSRMLDIDRVLELPVDPVSAPIATVWSPPMSVLIGHMLRESDNTLADAIALRLAESATGARTWTGVGRAVTAALDEIGVDCAGAAIVDGSGLSRADHCTAAFLTDLLIAAWNRPRLRPILQTLPMAGETGTLRDRFAHAPEAVGAVRAKTGTLTGVASLCGVATGPRPIAFAILSGGVTDQTAARAALDEAAAAAVDFRE